jgi:hypothetical protein
MQGLRRRLPQGRWVGVTAATTDQYIACFNVGATCHEEMMMLADGYSGFVLPWLLFHQSRVEAESPSGCWFEKWSPSSPERVVRTLGTTWDQRGRGDRLTWPGLSGVSIPRPEPGWTN